MYSKKLVYDILIYIDINIKNKISINDLVNSLNYNRFYIMTSYNFLSFSGDYRRAHTRGETGICSENERNIEELRKEYFMF